MKEFPIAFGVIGKKLWLTLLLALTLIIYYFLRQLIPKGNNISAINIIGGAIAQMLSIVFPFIFKYKGKSPTSARKCTKTNFIHYSILFLIIMSILGMNRFLNYLNIETVSIVDTWSLYCFQILFYLILSIIILKSKYYIHNIISMIFFCIFTVIIDLIFKSLDNLELASFIYLIPRFIDDLLCCYMKYLIDKKYHSYWNILFFYGLFFFIVYGIELIIKIIKDPYDNSTFKAIRIAETKYIILNFFIHVIFYDYIRLLLTIIILDFFSLNHVLISHIVTEIVMYFIKIVSNYDKYGRYLVFLIPAFFQILSLLFYLEILEFNFCNLNRNTKRNIMLRGKEEMLSRSSDASNIEIDKDIIVKVEELKKEIELNPLINSDENEN